MIENLKDSCIDINLTSNVYNEYGIFHLRSKKFSEAQEYFNKYLTQSQKMNLNYNKNIITAQINKISE